uniref:PX domain-containing protein n=1 Tax=Globisporangium ultimum (strain ATCC 200006 / CBS 805.95 / DAOM BR144) TaxID=431595 RepID=K3X7Z6_GLOUD
MKNSSYYGATATAAPYDDASYGAMSRGMALEAAVEKLPDWIFGGDDDSEESKRWSERYGDSKESGALSSSGSSARPRRSYLYMDDMDPVMEGNAEVTGDEDDDEEEDEEANNKQYKHMNNSSESKSIRSSNLLSPRALGMLEDVAAKFDEPLSSSTLASTLDREHEKLSFVVIDTETAKATQKSNDTSPQSQKGSRTPVSRKTRLSSRRSTLSSSSPACTDLVVTRYTMGGREKKVMYHIDVVNHDNQLSTYTIRRSYTDFKVLHTDLSAVLEARKEYYMSRAQLRQSVLEPKDRRSASSNATGTDRPAGYTSSNSFMNNSNNSYMRSQFASPEDALEASVMAFNLPTLPSSGLMSFWRRHDHSHLKHRCEVFQGILRAILKMPFLRESFAMQKFLSTAPCAIRERGSSYVSLSEYSVPHIAPEDEHREWRRRAQDHRRNSSVTSSSLSMYEY